MLKAVIFDMDGLMVDSEPLWVKAEKATCDDLGVEFTPDLYHSCTGMRYDEVVADWYGKLGWKEPSVEEVAENLLLKAMDYILAEAPVLPGVYEILSHFKEEGIPCALASSSPYRLINAVLENFDFKDYFSVVCSAEEEEFGKPHPAVYLTTAKKLDISPEHCLVFEDSVNGTLAAKAAKMKAVVVPAKEQFEDTRFGIADYKFSSLVEGREKIVSLFN